MMTTTVENHTRPTNFVPTSSPTFLSQVLVGHTPKAIRDFTRKGGKKQKALEEKEQKRREREEKKKLREQEAKRKAEEKAR